MEIKVLQPVDKFEREFETPEQFNIFYSKNKENTDKQTTHILNKKYKIEGFVITRQKGELCLKKPWIKKNKTEHVDNDLEERVCILEKTVDEITDLKQRVSVLEKANDEITDLKERVHLAEDTINKIIDVLQPT